MTLLILGLVLFLGSHSVRIVAEDWRTARIAAMGEQRWKLVYSVFSIASFVLLVYGYGQARAASTALFDPAPWLRHVAALLTLPAFVLVAAAYVPGTRIKARIGHPMIMGVKIWAFAHLIANGRAADVVLFGAFLVWAIADYAAARRRDRAAGVVHATGPVARDVAAIVAGIAAWAVFGFWLHGPLIGVRPFG